MNRREFSRALAALGSITVGSSVGAISTDRAALHLVYDTRLATIDSPHFSAWNGPLYRHSFDGDVTQLWLEVLSRLWRDPQSATAGFTRYAEFFVLKTLAADHGYRVAATNEREDHLSWLLLHDKEPRRDLFKR